MSDTGWIEPGQEDRVACYACMHWRQNVGTSEGECRRYPPHVSDGWPITQSRDRCGEFEPHPLPEGYTWRRMDVFTWVIVDRFPELTEKWTEELADMNIVIEDESKH